MLREAVEQAAKRPDVREAVEKIYAQLQIEIDDRKPSCSASGRCCRFDEYGHRLYVTTMELATFVAALNSSPPDSQGEGRTRGCIFQVEGLCSVHTMRPFGCRVFFCDSTSDDWQHAQYERFHAELQRLHDLLAVPYRYVEWRAALAELGLGGGMASGGDAKRLSLPQLRL
jgi:Fe-S-cluster containining protein